MVSRGEFDQVKNEYTSMKKRLDRFARYKNHVTLIDKIEEIEEKVRTLARTMALIYDENTAACSSGRLSCSGVDEWEEINEEDDALRQNVKRAQKVASMLRGRTAYTMLSRQRSTSRGSDVLSVRSSHTIC